MSEWAASGTRTAFPDPLPTVRRTVRALLESSPEFRGLDPDRRASLARSMVQVANAAALLVREELESVASVPGASPTAPPNADPDADPGADPGGGSPVLAVALAAAAAGGGAADGGGFGASARQVAGTTRAVLDAVSFPKFVSQLITGVFQAITESSRQQMNAYIELLNGVAASIEGFEHAAVGDEGARNWLVERYPGSFEVSGADEEESDPEERRQATLRLRAGAAMPPPEVLRVDLGLGPADSIPAGDPERSLVPFARRRLAKGRQEMLATMVMMGMQRIVVDGGRITAAMRFHIDTRSLAQQDRGSRSEFGLQTSGSGSFGVGAWGASASIQANVAYVSTERSQTTEEMNTALDLSSGVEVVFRSDYVPLERLATGASVERIRLNSRNPEAEESIAAKERQDRAQRQSAAEDQRRRDTPLTPSTAPAKPAAGSPGSPEAAERLRTEAAQKEAAEKEAAKKEAAKKEAARKDPAPKDPAREGTPAPAPKQSTDARRPPPARTAPAQT